MLAQFVRCVTIKSIVLLLCYYKEYCTIKNIIADPGINTDKLKRLHCFENLGKAKFPYLNAKSFQTGLQVKKSDLINLDRSPQVNVNNDKTSRNHPTPNL